MNEIVAELRALRAEMLANARRVPPLPLPGIGNTPAAQVGMVSDQPLTFDNDGSVSVNADTQLFASGTGTGRVKMIKVASTADTGVHIAFGGTAATTSHFLVEAGDILPLPTNQEIRAIKAGAGAVTVYRSKAAV